MNEHNAFIAIKMIDPEKKEFVTELVTRGKYFTDGNLHILKYNEKGMDENVQTCLTFNGMSATLERTGVVKSFFKFERGKVHRTCYETPYGTLSMDVTTTSVKSEFVGQRGNAELIYSVCSGNAYTENKHMKLAVRILD